jgi:hypothetical protein
MLISHDGAYVAHIGAVCMILLDVFLFVYLFYIYFTRLKTYVPFIAVKGTVLLLIACLALWQIGRAHV